MDLLSTINCIFKEINIYKTIIVCANEQMQVEVLNMLKANDYSCNDKFDDDGRFRVAVYTHDDLMNNYDFIYNCLDEVNLIISYKCISKLTSYNIYQLVSHQNARCDLLKVEI